jgi:small conductance mechanosensitive channel
VGVAYDTDLKRAITLIHDTLRSNPNVLQEPEMEPRVFVNQLAESSVSIAVRPWVAIENFGAAGGEINQAILDKFRDAGIAIPFPQREVRMLAA